MTLRAIRYRALLRRWAFRPITINGGGKNITITNAPTLIQNGAIHATGAITAGYGTGDQVDLQAHDHNVVNVGGGTGTITTTAPIAGT